jgi:hypothetical protein
MSILTNIQQLVNCAKVVLDSMENTENAIHCCKEMLVEAESMLKNESAKKVTDYIAMIFVDGDHLYYCKDEQFEWTEQLADAERFKTPSDAKKIGHFASERFNNPDTSRYIYILAV